MHRYVITWTETRTCTAEIESEKDPLEDEEDSIQKGRKEEGRHEEVEHLQILSSEKVDVQVRLRGIETDKSSRPTVCCAHHGGDQKGGYTKRSEDQADLA